MTQEIEKYNVHTKAHKRKLIKRWLIAIVVLAIIIWAFAGVPSLELKSKSLEILKSIFSGLFHPDISYIYIPDGEDLLRGLLETFAIAVVGTFIAAIICIPLAFLGANNMVKLRPVSGVSKFILSVIRGTYIYQSCWPRFIFRCISFRYPFRRYAWETFS